jgi:hypothetical protein
VALGFLGGEREALAFGFDLGNLLAGKFDMGTSGNSRKVT